MTNIPKKYQNLLEDFPFLTLVAYGGNEYVGIIQNVDNQLASMYNFETIKNQIDKKEFLDLGEEWWWGTNRLIPINIIFKSKWEKYRPTLISFSLKDFIVIHGPIVSLNNIIQRRVKRRNIQLVRKL
tara:strand:- start:6786 stop:7166 length:381 start_codon:yes stop_codon:yes gene_type:complete